MTYRAIALDLDGTLLAADAVLHDRVRRAICDLAASGVTVALASGRMQVAVEPIWRKLGLATPIVSYNGAKVGLPGREPIARCPVPLEAALRVADFAGERGLQLNAYLDETVLTER
jgi:HAD superfamily hydrolase (TIGR01484 family)